MDTKIFFIYLLIMAGSTYLIRVIPFVLVKEKIENRFIKSFLHYIPYAVLTSMTIPAALFATGSIWSALVGITVAVLLALKKRSLTEVPLLACLAVFAVDLVISLV
jgi:branched-subunit amino acid transport protein